jgi:dTDP-glucose 4,6-dehydratase
VTAAERRLLVTGGAGFIGSNFVHHWLGTRAGGRVVVLDALRYAGNPHNLAGLGARAEFRFVQADICDTPAITALLRDERLDTIVHFAAESHVDRSIAGPDAFIEANVLGTHSLLKAARAEWLAGEGARPHRFHHVSTDEVYGSLGPRDPAFTETTPYAPNSPYSASKAASDHLVRAYHHTYGLSVTTSNCSNNYGPRHFPEKLIPLIILNALEGRELPVYGDGSNVRDWLHVEDHARALALVLQHGQAGETYNVGGRNERTNLQVVEAVCDLIDELCGREGSRGLIRFVTDRPGHDHRYAIDATKLETELGWRAQESFDTGLRKTVAWYLERRDWWEPLRARYGGQRLGVPA